ncbi:unnamed protein product [Chilo suppressalis]|uniref:Rhodanese domain-containing protein n=1 Tax=Chilo suppressalis TaxID=168631 RepID=A0ABN8BEU9_CHISP|nr:unnamed protein product [Chilo suppressalis]
MPTDSECDCDLVSKEWLLAKLRSDERDTILIDCRGSNDYAVSHIRSAVNFSIPSIMLRRLAAGKIELASTVQCKELKARIAQCRTRGTFVLYGDSTSKDPDSVHGILLKRLKQDGVNVVCLEVRGAESPERRSAVVASARQTWERKSAAHCGSSPETTQIRIADVDARTDRFFDDVSSRYGWRQQRRGMVITQANYLLADGGGRRHSHYLFETGDSRTCPPVYVMKIENKTLHSYENKR